MKDLLRKGPRTGRTKKDGWPLSTLLANRWFKSGFWMALVGWTPLLAIVLLASIGLWPDPNPNPIGPALLFFFTK